MVLRLNRVGKKRHRPHRLVRERPSEVIKVLKKVCYRPASMKGDDLALVPTCTSNSKRIRKIITVPVGRKRLLVSTLGYILRNADLSTHEFMDLRY